MKQVSRQSVKENSLSFGFAYTEKLIIKQSRLNLKRLSKNVIRPQFVPQLRRQNIVCPFDIVVSIIVGFIISFLHQHALSR